MTKIKPFYIKRTEEIASQQAKHLGIKEIKTESDYDKGMREAMKKIAISCNKKFGFDVGYEDLPDLVESLVNHKPEQKEPKFKYVKVEDSAFDLKDELEAGELFYCSKYYAVELEYRVSNALVARTWMFAFFAFVAAPLYGAFVMGLTL